MDKFDSKGVDEGDPIAIALFVFFLFLILTWLLSSSSPLPANQRSATAANVVSQFRFVLLIIVPIAIIGLFRQMGGESEDFKREVNEAQLAFTRGVSAKIAEFNARQRYRRKPKGKGPLTESETL